VAFFCADPDVTAETTIEAIGDRQAIEQDFHDVKLIHVSEQQQVCNVWSHVACWNVYQLPITLVVASFGNDSEAEIESPLG
jgi:hypothetical protein